MWSYWNVAWYVPSLYSFGREVIALVLSSRISQVIAGRLPLMARSNSHWKGAVSRDSGVVSVTLGVT